MLLQSGSAPSGHRRADLNQRTSLTGALEERGKRRRTPLQQAIGDLHAMKIPFLRVPNDEPLKDLPYERYLRIVGLFRTIPNSLFTNSDKQELATSFNALQKEIEAMVDPESRRFTRDDAADYVHNLHLLLVQILPLPVLGFMMHALREDFREVMGAESYQQYMAADACDKVKSLPVSDPAYEIAARADATYVVNETRRQQLAQRHVEQTRHFLFEAISDGWVKVCLPLALIVLLFVTAHAAGQSYHQSVKSTLSRKAAPPEPDRHLALVPPMADAAAPDDSLSPPAGATRQPKAVGAPPATVFGRIGQVMVREDGDETPMFKILCGLAVLAAAGMCGASGAYLSVLTRIQGVGDDSHIGRNVWVLHSSSTAARLAPVTGMIFALVLSAILAGQLVSGSLFPNIDPEKLWVFIFWQPTEIAKWLVWAFIAGFSERLVPDMIDRFTARHTDDTPPDDAPPRSGGVTAPPLPLPVPIVPAIPASADVQPHVEAKAPDDAARVEHAEEPPLGAARADGEERPPAGGG